MKQGLGGAQAVSLEKRLWEGPGARSGVRTFPGYTSCSRTFSRKARTPGPGCPSGQMPQGLAVLTTSSW